MEEIKKKAINKMGELASDQLSNTQPPSSEPAGDSSETESNPTIVLDYSRIHATSGEGYLFEKILLCCYQCLNNNSNFLDIHGLCRWFQSTWNIQIIFAPSTFYSLFPANIKFTPSFSQNTFSASNNFPDSKLPGEMKDFANEYSDIKSLIGSSPSALKRACISLIAVIIHRIYSNSKYIDIRERNIILDKIMNFMQLLQRGEEFNFLRKGKNFKQYLQPAITTLTEAIEEVKATIQQPKQIPAWLRDYLEHAKNIIDGLPLYTHYMLQGVDIKISAIKYALEEIYKKYINILSGDEIAISPARAAQIRKLVNAALLIIKANFPRKENIRLEDIRNLVNNKLLNVSQAGFYIDYVFNQAGGMNLLEQAAQGKIVFNLNADQFLRELIYNTGFCKATFIDTIVHEGLGYYDKLTTNKETQEYSLTLLRQHVLRTDKTMKSAADDKKQLGNPMLYMELAERALKPQLIDFSSGACLTTWAPGVFSVFQKESKKKPVQDAAEEYFNLLCMLTAINQELAAYCWFVQTLEKSCFSSGSLQVTILHREFLRYLSERTLKFTLVMIKKALFEFRNRRRESAKEILVAEAARINQTISSKWVSIGLEVAKKEFYTKMIASISALEHVCRSLESYVSDNEIKRHMGQTEDIDSILAMAASITMPDAKEYMHKARLFGQDARERLNGFLLEPEKTRYKPSQEEKSISSYSDDKEKKYPTPSPSPLHLTEESKTEAISERSLQQIPAEAVNIILNQAENILEPGLLSAEEFKQFIKSIEAPEIASKMLSVFLPVACHFFKKIPMERTPDIIANFERISEVLIHVRNLLPPSVGLESATLADSIMQFCQSKDKTAALDLYDSLQNLRKKIELLPPAGALSKVSMFALPVKTSRSIDGEKRILKNLADLCATSKGVLAFIPSSLPFKKFYRLSDDLVTDEAKYQCALSLLNATEALSERQMNELPKLEGVISLLIKLLTADNIFFITQPNSYQYLQAKLEILRATIILFQSQIPEPDHISQITAFFQEIISQLSAFYLVENQVTQQANDLINASCDHYIDKYQSRPPLRDAILAIRNTASHELSFSNIEQLSLLFAEDKRLVYIITYAHFLTKSLISNYHLQDERACLINRMVAKIADEIGDYWQGESKATLHQEIYRRIQKIFCFFSPESILMPLQDSFLVAETSDRLKEFFDISVTFNSLTNCYERVIDKDKKYTSSKVEPEAIDMILFMLNKLRKIDTEIITQLPKTTHQQEEHQANLYSQFKEQAELVNIYGLSESELVAHHMARGSLMDRKSFTSN